MIIKLVRPSTIFCAARPVKKAWAKRDEMSTGPIARGCRLWEKARADAILRGKSRCWTGITMTPLASLFAILGALLVGAISPGPSFVFVVRTAVARSRIDGLAAALGMGVGAMIFGALALFGLRALMSEAAGLYWALRIAGGLYLLYLAFRIWRGASEPIVVAGDGAGETAPLRSFWLGLLTQLSNPKIVAVFGAVFAALLPADHSSALDLALPPMIFLQETAWYALVALAFSSARPRALYLRAKVWIDRAAGAVIGVLGARLLWEAR
jgi:threonine/homoserine/homoserine lactone efflux protein